MYILLYYNSLPNNIFGRIGCLDANPSEEAKGKKKFKINLYFYAQR